MTPKTLLTMFRAPRYSFRASEPSMVVRADKSRFVGEPAVTGIGTGHARPFSLRHTEVLDVPLPDERPLCVMGENMLRKARAAGQPLSLVVMQVHDLPEVELVFGRAAAAQAIHQVMDRLTLVAARNGLLVRSAADTFALLVPESGAEATVAAVNARFGEPCVIEFESDGAEVLLVPDVRVHTLEVGESVQQVYERTCRLIAQERGREELRCDYIRKEREAYTRPMGLPLRPSSEPSRRVYYPALPATMPVPMGAR